MTQAKSTQLKPCPFCKSGEIKLLFAKDMFWIECCNCESESYAAHSAEDAKRGWNSSVGKRGRSLILYNLRCAGIHGESMTDPTLLVIT